MTEMNVEGIARAFKVGLSKAYDILNEMPYSLNSEGQRCITREQWAQWCIDHTIPPDPVGLLIRQHHDVLLVCKKIGFVYFVGDSSFVKIGHTHRVRNRLDNLQTASPNHLELLGVMPGSREMESRMHREFSTYHVRGEWFRNEGSLRRMLGGKHHVLPKKDCLPKAIRALRRRT